jgi:molybdate transport system ATP-binding protein
MNNGKIETSGNKEAIFDSPKTLAAALMTGCKNISKAEKLDNFRVKAIDWGIVLQTEQLVPDSVKHIGVRAHHFERAATMSDKENMFACRIQRVIEEPFERVFVFSFAMDNSNSATLQFEQAKNICADWDFKEFLLHIPADKVMCLE